MTMHKLTIGAVAAASCLTAFAVGPIAVKVAKPETVTESEAVTIVGRVVGSHQVDLTPRVTGTIWERKGEEGASVKKGDVLYRIEDTVYKANLQTAKAELAELEAKLAQAEIDAKRYTEGESKGGVSKADRDRAILSRDVDKAKVEAAKAKVALCENDLAYCTIASPIDGVLGRYSHDVGNNVAPGCGVLRDVICVDPIDVTVAIPEQVFHWAFEKRSEKGEVHRRLLRSDGKEMPLDLKPFAVDNKVDAATGTVMVRFRGKNPDRVILPGGYVKLALNETFPTPKLAVPMSAVVFEGDERYVYVIAGGRTEKRKVALGAVQGDRVIVEAGLKADEAFAPVGIHKLFDGAAVKEI